MITTYHNINFSTQTVPEQIPVVQGDTGREIVFILTDFTIPEGATATYYVQKPSGEAVYNTATISENNIIVPLTAQSIIEVGENDMQVRVILGEDIVTSFRAILMVRPFLGIGAVESSTEMNIFDQAVEAAKEEFQTEAEAIAEEVIESIPEDYTALSNEVNDLKTDLTQVDNVVTGRIVGGEKSVVLSWTDGYIKSSDGSIGSSSNYHYSQPIYVIEGDEYSLAFSAGTSNTHFAIAMYDGTSVTANMSKSVPGGSSKTTFTGTIPAGIKYICICTQKAVTATLTMTVFSLADAKGFGVDIEALGTDITTLKANDNIVLSDKYNPVMTADTMDLSIGYLSTGGVFNESQPGATQRTTNYVSVIPGVLYKMAVKNAYGADGTLRWISLYKQDKTFSRDISSGSDLTNMQFVTTGEEYFVRVNTNLAGGAPSVFNIYPDGWQNGTKELNSGLDVPQIASIKKPDTLHYRRPIISFILDGFKNMNQDMIDVFENHGYNIGIAPGYQEFNVANNNVYNAHQWEKNGHEILVHGSVVIQTEDDVKVSGQPTYTEQEGAEMIKSAYTIPASYGFAPKGYIASRGAMSSVFYKYVKQYFSWGALVNNRSEDQTAYHLFDTSDPYLMWRYSMQLSTLDQMKNAVDTAIANGGLLMFYGHAESQSLGYFTAENLNALLTYIDAYVANHSVTVKTPFEAMKDYYTIRYWDVVT